MSTLGSSLPVAPHRRTTFRTRRFIHALLAIVAALAMTIAVATAARADCSNAPGGGTPLGNVVWGLTDSLAACPAGDSVLAGRPSRLRIWISYSDANCNPKIGVPPESIWVFVSSTTSNLKVNDEGAKIFADDSTDGSGYARVTIPSFSGNGTVSIGVAVSGKGFGAKSVTVRTTDTNADGRSDAADATGYSDINYSGGSRQRRGSGNNPTAQQPQALAPECAFWDACASDQHVPYLSAIYAEHAGIQPVLGSPWQDARSEHFQRR